MSLLKLTMEAEYQFWELEAAFVRKRYDTALLRLFEAVEYAADQLNLGRHRFLAAPRPAPELASLGFRWMLYNRYWFAYSTQQPPLITAIIYANTDIVRHARHLSAQ